MNEALGLSFSFLTAELKIMQFCSAPLARAADFAANFLSSEFVMLKKKKPGGTETAGIRSKSSRIDGLGTLLTSCFSCVAANM